MNDSRISLPTSRNLETIKSWVGCHIQFCDRGELDRHPYTVRQGILLSVGSQTDLYHVRVMQSNNTLFSSSYGFFEWIEVIACDPED